MPCVGVFTDPSTSIQHQCAHTICYPEDPLNSPADCQYYCPEYYACLLREHQGQFITTPVSETLTPISEHNGSHIDSQTLGRSGLGITSVDVVIIGLSVTLAIVLLLAISLFGIFWKRNVRNNCRSSASGQHTCTQEEDATEMTELQSQSATVYTTTRSASGDLERRHASQETSFTEEPSPLHSQTFVKTVVGGSFDRQAIHSRAHDSYRPLTSLTHHSEQPNTLRSGGFTVVPGAPQQSQTNQGPLQIRYARTSFPDIRAFRNYPPTQPPLETYMEHPESSESAVASAAVPSRSSQVHVLQRSISVPVKTPPETEHHPSISERHSSVPKSSLGSHQLSVYYDGPVAPLVIRQNSNPSQNQSLMVSSHGTQTDDGTALVSIEAATQTDIVDDGPSTHREVSAIQESEGHLSDTPLSIPTQESSSLPGLTYIDSCDLQHENSDALALLIHRSEAGRSGSSGIQSSMYLAHLESPRPVFDPSVTLDDAVSLFAPSHEITPHPPFASNPDDSHYDYQNYQSHTSDNEQFTSERDYLLVAPRNLSNASRDASSYPMDEASVVVASDSFESVTNMTADTDTEQTRLKYV